MNSSLTPTRKFSFYKISSSEEYKIVEKLRRTRSFGKKIYLLFLSPWDNRSKCLSSILEKEYGSFNPLSYDSFPELMSEKDVNKLVFVVDSWTSPELFAARDIPAIMDTVPSVLVVKPKGKIVREDYYPAILDLFFNKETFNSLRESLKY